MGDCKHTERMYVDHDEQVQTRPYTLASHCEREVKAGLDLVYMEKLFPCATCLQGTVQILLHVYMSQTKCKFQSVLNAIKDVNIVHRGVR